jgi:HSP20 family protein
MALVRWSPFQDLDAAERRMRQMLDQVGLVPACPAADVYESHGEYVYELEVPGYEEKDLAVEVSDHMLTVRGEKTETKEEKDKTYFVNERLAKRFERRFELPSEAITDRVRAEFEKGLLVVHAPKAEAAKPRTIEIAAKT